MSKWQTSDIIDFFKYHEIIEKEYLDFLAIHKINGNLMNSYLGNILKDMGIYDNNNNNNIISKKLKDEITNHWNQIALKEISPNFALKTPKV